MLVRCDSCQGKKRMLAMGGMEKPCIYCKGIGWVEDEPAPSDEKSSENIFDDTPRESIAPVKKTIKKKPGRKKKY